MSLLFRKTLASNFKSKLYGNIVVFFLVLVKDYEWARLCFGGVCRVLVHIFSQMPQSL